MSLLNNSAVSLNESISYGERLKETIEHECHQLKIWEDTVEDAVIEVNLIKSDLVIYYGQMDAMKINLEEEDPQ